MMRGIPFGILIIHHERLIGVRRGVGSRILIMPLEREDCDRRTVGKLI